MADGLVNEFRLIRSHLLSYAWVLGSCMSADTHNVSALIFLGLCEEAVLKM